MKKHRLNIYPEMKEEAYVSLKNDIEINGYDFKFPIWIYEDEIIDGWNRFKACKELGIIPIYEKFIGDEIQAINFILRTNNRRDLTSYQRTLLALEFEEMFREKAKKNQIRKANSVPQISAKQNIETRKELAKIAKVSHDTISKVKKIQEKAPQEVKAKLATGEVSINAAYKEIKKEEKKEEKIAERKRLAEEGAKKEIEIDFRLGDFEEVFADLPDGSIDCIITDPPYPYEFIEVWTKLSRFAKRVLKPNGFCIAYSGQMYLPEVMKRMSENLDYYWTFTLIHTGSRQLINGRNLFCGWKPILIFQNNFSKLKTPFDDFIQGTGSEKKHHKWQQAELELNHIIDNFTNVGDTILEPFAGGGTTIMAALKNNRNIKAAEINEESFNISKKRIADAKIR